MAVAEVFSSFIRIRQMVSRNRLETRKMIDWFPVVALIFKVLVLGTGMFFAIKWHYDQGKKAKGNEDGNGNGKHAVLLAAGKVAAVFVLSLLCLVLLIFFVASKIGLDLTFP